MASETINELIFPSGIAQLFFANAQAAEQPDENDVIISSEYSETRNDIINLFPVSGIKLCKISQ